MNVGLPFVGQVQNATLTEVVGWVYTALKAIVTSITTGYHTQHNVNDTHKAITSTGSITERSRAVAQGVWINVSLHGVTFSNGWSVSPTSFVGLAYTLIGTTMLLSWNFAGTSIGDTPATLTFTIGSVIAPTRVVHVPFHYNDNGTYAVGRATVSPILTGVQGLRVTLYKVNFASWSASSLNTDVSGQIACEVSGV